MDFISALIAILSCSDLEMIRRGLTTLKILSVFNFDILLAIVEPESARFDRAERTIIKSKQFSKDRR